MMPPSGTAGLASLPTRNFVHITITTMPLFSGPWMDMMHHAMPSFDLETLGQLVQSTSAINIQGVAAHHQSSGSNRYYNAVRLLQRGDHPGWCCSLHDGSDQSFA